VHLHRLKTAVATLLLSALPALAAAQVTPAAGYTPPDDTPSIHFGVTFFGNYTYQKDPKITDADGNSVSKSSFDVARSYINITGNVSHVVAFRITPDVTRESSLLSLAAGNSVPSDSLVFRIKYAFAQFNLDDWMTKGSWARLGIQQTPWVDFEEGIYRYRFQGTVFSEREGFLSSSDAGASFHYSLPSNYGDVHVGVYNGETYSKAETNNEKALQFRGTLRPFATGAPVLRGLRAHLFYDADKYVMNAERKRLIGSLTFEHQYLNGAFEYLDTHDQTSAKPGTADANGKGFSIWATPRAKGWEALLRYDHLTPNTSALISTSASPNPGTTTFDSQKRNRTIVGVSYWFPHQGSVSSALLLDYDAQVLKNITTAPTKTIAVHALLNF
jgi:hypothetical protein